MNITKIKFRTIESLPSLNSENWEENLLLFLVNKMICEGDFSSIYVETLNADASVKFYLSTDRELMTNKESIAKRIYSMSFEKFVWFLNYINKCICKSNIATIGSCILSILDNKKRYNFSVYSRKSTILSCFLQIDRFKDHL